MGLLRTAFHKMIDGPRVGQVQRYYDGITPDLGRFPYLGGIPFGTGYTAANQVSMLAREAYDQVGPVGAVMYVRLHLFSEITFRWQQLALDGRPVKFFGTPELSLLERPWPGGSTPDLLHVMELDGSMAGQCYMVREQAEYTNGDVLTRLDPAKVTIATGSNSDPLRGQEYGQFLTGYLYRDKPTDKPIFFPPEIVVHYRPLPSCSAPQFFGQSWLSSILPDAASDARLTSYKSSFLENGAVPGLIVSFKEPISKEQAQEMVQVIGGQHTGPLTAGKTLYLGGGADPKTVGMSFDQLNLHAVQGAGESRIAAAGGVPATIVGFSEGLSGSTLNAGNYGAARRRLGDATLRPLWRKACMSLVRVMATPSQFNGIGARLWYDDRDVAFLQEDVKDEADIRAQQAQTIRTLIDGGYEPDAASAFADTGDASALKGRHSGLAPVQVQQAGATPSAVPSAA